MAKDLEVDHELWSWEKWVSDDYTVTRYFVYHFTVYKDGHGEHTRVATFLNEEDAKEYANLKQQQWRKGGES